MSPRSKTDSDKKTVAVVVPIYTRNVSSVQEVSLRHLRRFLGAHDRYLIMPENLDFVLKKDDFLIKIFDGKFFNDKVSYNKLLLSEEFYKAFYDYEYVLIYQLDSLIFSDQLLNWCNKGYDYVGAPWYKKVTMNTRGMVIPDEDSVGNGGLSLRKVESHLKVLAIYNSCLKMARYKLLPHPYLFMYYLSRVPRKILDFIAGKQGLPFILKNIYLQGYRPNEDMFWSFEAKKYYPDFKIPPPEVAVSFSFEIAPRYCFEKNNRTLPFGCHAWYKHDKTFWEPYLLQKD